jgi:hypothetical protein
VIYQTERFPGGGTAMLTEEGAYVIARALNTVAVSRRLLMRTRDLMLTYRAHRFRVVSGGSDSPNGEPSSTPRRGSLGGYARAARLTAEQRREIARQAAQARWERFRNGIGTGPPDARLGGLARAQRLTPVQRQQIARKALEARLSGRRGPNHDDSVDDGNGSVGVDEVRARDQAESIERRRQPDFGAGVERADDARPDQRE